MDKWIKKRFTIYAILSSIVVSSILAFSIGSLITYKVMPKKEQQIVELTDDENLNKLLEVYKTLDMDYLSKLDPYNAMQGAIKGMLETLDDPYTTYMDIEESKNFLEDLSGEYEGIGASLNEINGVITIDTPFKNSPAEKAGILPNDQIVEVNKENVIGKELQETIGKIKGPKGSEVELGIKRSGHTGLLYIKVVRDVIPLFTVTSDTYTVNNKLIGYLDITQFSRTTYQEFKEQLTVLESKGIDGLVVDVRRNPGGYLDIVSQIMEEFIPAGKNIYGVEENGKQVFIPSTGKGKKEYSISVLIDEGSASASEIFASTMKESGKYEVVGVTSFGKGTVQTTKQLSDGSTLKYTIQKWLTPEGNWIHKKGVTPTIEVKQPEYFSINLIGLTEEVKYDTVSEQVKNAQVIMNALGEHVRTDGYFDKNTKDAITNLQKKNKLTVTGTLNQETASYLENTIIVKVRDKKNDLQLQKALDIVSSK